MRFRRVLIVADIEGSSGCGSYAASSFLTPEWALACADMTRDVQAVVPALFRAGVETVIVKDFHRTGYNLLPEWIDVRSWRSGLARRAAASLENAAARPLDGGGPFLARVTFRDGVPAASRAARRWRLQRQGASVSLEVENLAALFTMLSRICYLRPALLPVLPAALHLHNLKGRLGLAWVRRYLRGRGVKGPRGQGTPSTRGAAY